MIKKIGQLVLFAGLFITLLSPISVRAQSGLTILDSSVQLGFPSHLGFTLAVESDVNVTDIRLYYQVDQIRYAEVTSEVFIDFEPDTKVDVSWTWDMRKTAGLPPGAIVDFWWMVTDASGHVINTNPAQIQFSDLRYEWRSITEGKVTIYWYNGDENFAQELMAAAKQALFRLAADTGAELEKPVSIYIYASARDLQSSMIFPREWSGGVAFTRFGTIAIGIAPDKLDWGTRAMAHELAHLVIHQMTLNPYNEMPTWLDEGLAMYAEGEPEPELATFISVATARDLLISVRSLSSPFSALAGEATLAYAQSYSLVEFLIRNYGQGKMLELLSAFRQGSDYDEALSRVYGFDMDGLNTMWLDSIGATVQPTEEKGLPPAIIGVLIVVAVGVVIVLVFVVRKRARRRG